MPRAKFASATGLPRGKIVVSVEELAEFFECAPRWVQELAKRGMPKDARGRYDFVPCVRWYLRFLKDSVEHKTGPEDIRTARIRQAIAEADLKEIEVSKARGELVSTSEAARLWEDAVSKMRSRLIASISYAAPRVIGLKTIAEANGILEGIVYEALSSVASLGSEGADGDDSGDTGD